jgi:prepilin-type N-terminal cleavage/methylation domain-containing protein
MKTFGYKKLGFTLVEMAIVLVIIGLLLGGMLMPLSAQMDQRRNSETQKALDEIKNALIGFAIAKGRLPCPTTTADPANVLYGDEDATCDRTTNGYLPWKALGVAETDAWGIIRTTTASPWIGYWRYRVDPGFADKNNLFSLTTAADGTLKLSVQNSLGVSLTTTTQRPLAIVFSTGKNLTADGQNANFLQANAIYQSDTPSSTFDDITIWLAAPTLFNRMVAAGKLP